MNSKLKNVILILIPLLITVFIGYIFSQPKYYDEISGGSDNVDALRWTAISFFFYGFWGLIIGLILDFLIWLMITSPKNGK